MNIHCLGMNHRTAPIAVREKLWFSTDEIRAVLPSWRNTIFQEGILVSTCNRTELYFVPGPPINNSEPLWKTLARFKGAHEIVTESHFYSSSGAAVPEHLFAVASGIDSMILGDVQILNQMKEAFAVAQEVHATGVLTNRLFTTAFHVGKRARTETEISEGAVSVSYAAAELASRIFDDLSKRTALLIGAGETGKLTARHLAGRKLGHLFLANRTRARAEELVQHLGGEVVEFDRILEVLPLVDVIISSVEVRSPILQATDIRKIMKLRGNNPLLVIDIGVPRNIDPEAHTIDNVFLHDIDSLNQMIDYNLAHRKAEIPTIEKIIAEELAKFTAWHDSLDVTPTIQQLSEQFEAIRLSEVESHLHRFTKEERENIDLVTKRIVNKILHTPIVNLKNGTGDHHSTETQTKIHIVRYLFGLEKKNDQ